LVALLASTNAVPKPEIAKLNGKVHLRAYFVSTLFRCLSASLYLFTLSLSMTFCTFSLSFSGFLTFSLSFSGFPHLFSVILRLSAPFLCHSLAFRTFSLSFSSFPHIFTVILWLSAHFLCHSLTFRNFFVILWLSAPFPCRSLAFCPVIIVLSNFVSVLPFICLFV
jgi:hypothetical protein